MSGKMIRGLTTKEYAIVMHKIESGDRTEESIIKSGLLYEGKLLRLKPSTRGGINKARDNSIFSNRRKERGKGGEGICRVPTCDNKQSRRGLCNHHRVEAYRMVKKDRGTRATMQNLLNRGLLLPKASGGKRVSKRSKSKTGKKAKGVKKTKVKAFPKKLLNATTCLYKKCTTPRKGGSRGLCKRHYSMYRRKKRKLTDRKRKALDRDLIKRRMLLPLKPKSKRIKRIKAKKVESSAFEIGATMHGSIRRY